MLKIVVIRSPGIFRTMLMHVYDKTSYISRFVRLKSICEDIFMYEDLTQNNIGAPGRCVFFNIFGEMCNFQV